MSEADVYDLAIIARDAPVRIGHLSQIDTFVTDRRPPEAIEDICRHNGVALEIAPGGPEEAEGDQ